MTVCVNGSLSSSASILSGVPQGSVLGPLLFILYVNDLPNWIRNNMRMFADDTKIWCRLTSQGNSHGLQEDLNRLGDWSDKWLLRLNSEKCKVMHMGHSYQTSYFLRDGTDVRKLECVSSEKDLGVYVTSNLKPSQQCAAAAAKASSILGLVKRHFRNLDIPSFKLIYKLYIRPHLEYSIQAWSPQLKKDVACLERIQRRATKIIPGFKKKSYAERLVLLNLTTLEQRRVRGDLIETFKLLTGRERVDWHLFFQLENTGYNLRGHSLKLSKPRCNTVLRSNTFSCRIVDQ